MTPLTKPVTRKTESTVRDGGKRRRLVLTLYPNGTLGLRPEKTRREERLTIEAAYDLAVRLRVIEERKAKKKQNRR